MDIKYYIFRNHTLESIFGTQNISYSGYDDISFIEPNAESYIWFYQVPIKFDFYSLAEEIGEYWKKLQIIYDGIPIEKQFIIFSLENLYNLNYYNTDYKLKSAILKFNNKARKFAEKYSNVKFVDFSEFLIGYSNNQWIDWKYYFISQTIINPKLSASLRDWFTNKIREFTLNRKKCLVLDLDNTLWNGVLGEDGIKNIGIGGDYPGNAFLYFQEALVELSKQGVILTVCSKNNESDVLDAWEKNPFIKLNKNYISAYRINWENKAENIKDIAKELNLGLDSFVFVDDNPAERELVKQFLPMVEVPDFPQHPYLLPAFFSDLVSRYFSVYTITEEDKKKTEQYKANIHRLEEQNKFIDFSDYLISLGMEISVIRANEFNISRIAQMTQKTNQFNLTTRRYSDSDIHRLIVGGYIVFCISVKDKFGDNGITGTIILEPVKDGFNVDTFLLSCRILGKGIEFAFIYYVLNFLLNRGVETIYAEYHPTLKNAQVSNFYEKLGFHLLKQTEEGTKFYKCRLLKKYIIEPYYKIKTN